MKHQCKAQSHPPSSSTGILNTHSSFNILPLCSNGGWDLMRRSRREGFLPADRGRENKGQWRREQRRDVVVLSSLTESNLPMYRSLSCLSHSSSSRHFFLFSHSFLLFLSISIYFPFLSLSLSFSISLQPLPPTQSLSLSPSISPPFLFR